MEKTFTLSQVLDLLVSMDNAINPDEYPVSRKLGLEPEDYIDLAVCKADELNIGKEYKEYRASVISDQEK